MGVLKKRRNSAVVLTFDWPERRSTAGPAEAAELASVIEAADQDPEVAGGVLARSRAFCAADDLDAFAHLA